MYSGHTNPVSEHILPERVQLVEVDIWFQDEIR